MPKQVFKINAFHGGINSSTDPRDIDDKEVVDCVNLVVGDAGIVRTIGSNAAHNIPILDNTGTSSTNLSGSGLFSFSHDRTGGEDAGSSEAETGDNYLALYDDNDAQVWIAKASTTADWDDDINSSTNGVIDFKGKGTSNVARPSFFSVDGALRVSSGEFAKYDSSSSSLKVINNSNTIIPVTLYSDFAVGNYIQIDDEILYVISVNNPSYSGSHTGINNESDLADSTKSFETDEFSDAEIFGIESVFYEFHLDEFSETNELDFLKPYWMHAFVENEVVLNDFVMAQTECYVELNEGWNLIPNPHLATYDIEQLVFLINNEEYEFYSAVQNGLIEPTIYEFDNYFNSVNQVLPLTAYYLYVYDDDISLKFIPFYENWYSPEFLLDWKLKIIAEQSDFSSIIVGTSLQADSLYNPYYDYLKPTHKPFVDGISFYIPDNSDGLKKLHQSITAPQNPNSDFLYSWSAQLELNNLDPILFEKKEDDI